MKDLIIIGAGGFGREIKDIIGSVNRITPTWNLLGFYDDAYTKDYIVSENISCLGTVNDLIKIKKENLAIVFGIADREIVFSILKRLENKGNFSFPNIFHPSVEINYDVLFGKGNVIASGSILTCNIEIGDFNFFNSLVAVGHDVRIKDFNCLMPRTQISGDVKIGSHNFFGMNSAVVQNKSIGNHNIINAYTLLTKSIKDKRKYFGIPGKRINN